MYRSDITATTDSQATESSTKTGYFPDMDYQRVQSEKTNYGPNQQRFSSPFEPLSMSQNNRNRNVLMEKARSEMNRPLFQYNYAPAESSSGAIDKPWRQQPVTSFMTSDWTAQSTYPDRLAITNGSDESEDEFDEVDGYEPFSQLRRPPVQLQMHHSQAVPMPQYVYSRAIPTVAELKSNPLWNRILSNSDSAGPSTTVMAPTWKSETYGNKKTGRDQYAATTQSYTQSFNSDKSFDELAESKSYNSMALAKTLLAKSEKDAEMERYMLMKRMQRRPRGPLLTRYSPEVLCEIDANSTDLFPLSTSVSSTRENVNQEPSSNFNNSPQPSNKELNKTGDDALRPQTSPAESREPETASTEGESSVTSQSDKEHTTLLDTTGFTESVSSSPLTFAESQPKTPANESAQNVEITNLQNATTVNETQAAMQPLKFVDSPVAPVIENENVPSQESQMDVDDSISVPAAPQSDASNEMNHSGPAPSEDCHNKPIGETMYATPSVSPATFIRPMSIINEETPLECPNNVDGSSAMIPVTSQSNALNEAIMFGSVPAPNLLDHCYIIPPQETVFTTPPPLSPAQYIFPIDSTNASIEQTIFWSSQNAQENLFADIGIPTAPFISIPADLPDGKTVEVTAQLPQTQSVIPPSQQSSLETPNVIQTPTVIPPTTSKPKAMNSKERRPYNRKNKVQIQSNEMIVAPPVSSVTGAPPNNNVQINPQQAIGEQKPSNIANNLPRIQMPSKPALNLPVKSDVTPSNPLKRKNPDNLQAPNKAKLPKASGTGANSTKTSAATLKRKNKENVPPNVPVKTQKMDKSAQVINKHSAGNLLTVNLPDITIQRVGQNVKNTIGGADRQSSKDRLFFDTIQKLQRNGVSVFKIPPSNGQQQQLLKAQQKPSNPVMDKYKKVLQMNNVSIERLN